MVQFEWHDGTVKNIHVDLPSLYEYQVSAGSPQSECGVWGGRWEEGVVKCGRTKPVTEAPPVNRLCCTHRPFWSFLHLLSRQEPGGLKQKPLILLVKIYLLPI